MAKTLSDVATPKKKEQKINVKNDRNIPKSSEQTAASNEANVKKGGNSASDSIIKKRKKLKSCPVNEDDNNADARCSKKRKIEIAASEQETSASAHPCDVYGKKRNKKKRKNSMNSGGTGERNLEEHNDPICKKPTIGMKPPEQMVTNSTSDLNIRYSADEKIAVEKKKKYNTKLHLHQDICPEKGKSKACEVRATLNSELGFKDLRVSKGLDNAAHTNRSVVKTGKKKKTKLCLQTGVYGNMREDDGSSSKICDVVPVSDESAKRKRRKKKSRTKMAESVFTGNELLDSNTISKDNLPTLPTSQAEETMKKSKKRNKRKKPLNADQNDKLMNEPKSEKLNSDCVKKKTRRSRRKKKKVPTATLR